jgi:hypothetical protein
MDKILIDKTNEFTGVVGNSKIHMTLLNKDNQITGVYYYDKYKTDINLTGSIELTYKYYPTLTLYEETEQFGQFFGIFKNEDYIEGYWKNDEKIYPMYLIRTGSDILQPKESSEDNKQFDGHWYGVNSTYYSSSELEIKVLFDDLLFFEITAYNGPYISEVDGLAICQNGTATTTFNEILWEERNSDNVKFDFQIIDNELSLKANKYYYYCGIGGSFNDTYTRDEAKVSMPSPIEVGIVDTKEQEDLFLKIVDYDYYSFIQYTEYVMYEDIILDGKKARAGASYLRGASRYCYYINASDFLYAAIYEDDHINYYTNDPDYADHMPEPMLEWTYDYPFDIIYNGIEAPYPFDSKIPDLIKNQIKQIEMGEEITLPAHYTLFDHSVGDLNKDGYEDIAVVIEQGNGVYTGTRGIYIFLNNNGTYKLTYENRSLVLGRSEGGVFGDPYNGISILNGEFHVYDYGGSSDRWSHNYTFRYMDKQLVLTRIEQKNYSTHTLNGTVDIYNLIDGIMETRTNSEYDDENTDNPYNDVLIYSGKIKDAKDIAFQDAYAWCECDFNVEPKYPMPSLGYYEYGRADFAEIQHKAEKILDKVQQKYYKQMKKVNIPCSQDIIDNYSFLLGYEVPSYYYSDGEHILYYFSLELHNGFNRYEHTVCYDSLNENDWDETEFYWLWDDSGDERVFD